MKLPLAHFHGWLVMLLFLTAVTVFWSIAALIVWIAGNGTGTPELRKFAR